MFSPLSVSPKRVKGRESDGARGRYELTGRGLASCGLRNEKKCFVYFFLKKIYQPLFMFLPLSVSPKWAKGRESDGARGRYELTGRGLASCGLGNEKKFFVYFFLKKIYQPLFMFLPPTRRSKGVKGRESDGARGRYELTGRRLASCGLAGYEM